MTLRELPKEALERNAVVYVRQSTGVQVQENLESQRGQYELVELARRYGFRNVSVIAADLGRSASGTMDRPGFRDLVGRICEGSVGAVFCLEASRLARNGRDWHHLLELCGLVGGSKMPFARSSVSSNDSGATHKCSCTCGAKGFSSRAPSMASVLRSSCGELPRTGTPSPFFRIHFYTGAYAYGKSRVQTHLVEGSLRKRYGRARPMDAWTVLTRDHHEAYVPWETFERNRERLSRNSFCQRAGGSKSAREGRGLMAGLLRCRRCGRMLQVAYTGHYHKPRYSCRRGRQRVPPLSLHRARLRLEFIFCGHAHQAAPGSRARGRDRRRCR